MKSFELLLQTLKSITTLEPQEEELFLKAFKPHTIKKNEHFLQASEVLVN